MQRLILFLFFSLFPLQGQSAMARLELGGRLITVEIADLPENRAEGLKNRKHLAENQGMLFIFEKPSISSFWMKDTLIPLSIAFFDENRILINSINMQVPSNSKQPLKIYKSQAPALYALEMPFDWFRLHNVQPGMKFSFHQPSE